MYYKICLILFIASVIKIPLMAQGSIKGRVNNYTYDSLYPLPNATILNTTSRQSVQSDKNGYYTISAKENDQIIFSYINFTSETIIVTPQFFISGYDAALVQKGVLMDKVVVTSRYQVDSLRRMDAYRKTFEKQPGITGGNTPVAGVGIVLSPASFFSKGSKEQRRLKKRLIKEEEDKYIDYVFSPGRVTALTGLKGEELQMFFVRYRPAYEVARKIGYEGMPIYINDKFKEFKNPPTKTQKK